MSLTLILRGITMSEEQQFHIGQIFEGLYPPEAADFCNNSQNGDNPCYIKEIGSKADGTRRFKIVSNDPPDPKEEALSRIRELQSYLDSTDWYVPRSMETGEPIPEEVKTRRAKAREEISRLREKYNL